MTDEQNGKQDEQAEVNTMQPAPEWQPTMENILEGLHKKRTEELELIDNVLHQIKENKLLADFAADFYKVSWMLHRV